MLLCTHGTWILCSGQGILCKHGGNERRLSIRARSLGTFGHKRINEMFKLKELKHGSKFKKLVENPDHEKITDLLTVGQGKWEATRKNPHYAINRGPLTKEAKVWFYFLSLVILPTKYLCSVREQEEIILYAL